MNIKFFHTLILSGMVVFSQPTAAKSIAISLSGIWSTGVSTATRGWEFSTNVPITITDLGWWDTGNDGLVSNHQVGIWDASGSLLISGTVSLGVINPLIGGFRYTNALTGSLNLLAGNYIIGGKSSNSDTFAYAVTNLTMADGISFVQNRRTSTGVFAYPAITQLSPVVDPGVFGPNFQFTTANVPVSLPEPIILSFVIIGLFGFGFRRHLV